MDLLTKYKDLLKEFGEPINYWPQWCALDKSIEEREKIIIGMILVQRTSWHNANIALKNLKKSNLLSVKAISQLTNTQELTNLVRPAGFFQSKPQRLIDICTYVQSVGGVANLLKLDIETLRENLLKIKGVGKETADTIILYALEKPQFIIDEYTYRWVAMHGLDFPHNYDALQNFFHNSLERNVALYQNFHALIIISQRGVEKSKMEIV